MTTIVAATGDLIASDFNLGRMLVSRILGLDRRGDSGGGGFITSGRLQVIGRVGIEEMWWQGVAVGQFTSRRSQIPNLVECAVKEALSRRQPIVGVIYEHPGHERKQISRCVARKEELHRAGLYIGEVVRLVHGVHARNVFCRWRPQYTNHFH